MLVGSKTGLGGMRHATPRHTTHLIYVSRFPVMVASAGRPSCARGACALARSQFTTFSRVLARTSPSRFNGRFSHEARHCDSWASTNSPSTIVSGRLSRRRRETRPGTRERRARKRNRTTVAEGEREIVGGVYACVKLARKARDCFENDAFLERPRKAVERDRHFRVDVARTVARKRLWNRGYGPPWDQAAVNEVDAHAGTTTDRREREEGRGSVTRRPVREADAWDALIGRGGCYGRRLAYRTHIPEGTARMRTYTREPRSSRSSDRG